MTPNFPGMNPYLENPTLWSEVHSWVTTPHTNASHIVWASPNSEE